MGNPKALYEAVKAGKVRLDQVNDEGKAALKWYMQQKDSPTNQANTTPLSMIPGQQMPAPTLSRKGYTPAEQNKMMIDSLYGGGEKAPVSTATAFLGGAASGAALDIGLSELKEKYPEHKTAFSVGSFAGNILPFGAAYKGASTLTKGIAKPILRTAATGLIGDAPLGALKGAIEAKGQGEDALPNAAKEAALYGISAAVLGPLVELGIPALGRKIGPAVSKVLAKYRGAKVDPDVMAKEVAQDIGVTWENMNAKQREALRKLAMQNISEPAQSGRLLDAGQNFELVGKPYDPAKPPKNIPPSKIENIGYHAGDLGKADPLATMPGRSTGHYGTGTYFFGSKDAPGFKGYAEKRPVKEVSFEGYNLFRPESLQQGRKLHDLLKNINKFAFGSSHYRDSLKDVTNEAKTIFPDLETSTIVKEIRDLRKYTKESLPKDEYARFAKKPRFDSPSTKFMKNMGYDGIDVRSIKGLDDSEFGSVIYDLKGFKQTIEAPRIFDKNAFTGQSKTRRQIAEELGVLPRNPLAPPQLAKGDTVEFAVTTGQNPTVGTGKIMGMADDKVVIDSNGQRIIKGIDEVKKPLTPPEMPQAPKGEIDTKQMLAPVKSRGLKRAKEIIASLPTLPTKAYTAMVDNLNRMAKTNKVVKPQSISEDAYKLGMLTRNAEGTVDYIKNGALVDRSGQVIGESWRSIAKDIPEDLLSNFNDYLLHKHNIARYKQGKGLFGKSVTDELSARKVAAYEAKHPVFIGLSKRINDFIDKAQRAWGIDSGLVEQSLYDNVLKGMYPDYVPGFRQTIEGVKGNMFNKLGPAKIIKSAVGGDDKIIPPTESIPMLLEKLVKNARKNEAYQALLKQVRKNPNKMRGIAEVVDPDAELMASVINKRADYGIESVLEKFEGGMIEDARKGRFLIVMEGGQPKTLKINDPDYWKALKEIASPRQAGAIEKTGRKLTQPFKNVVTGYNPVFAVRNISRDIPTAVINSIENNPAVFGKNAKEALQEMMSNSKNFQEFTALGGARGNFFANTTGPTKYNPLQKVGDFNNLTETLPRFTEYLNTIKKGGGSYESKLEGIYNAAEVTVNFSRRGDVTKAIDAWVPYLNPAVQGLDKFGRQLINRPLATAAKGLATVTAPTTAIYMLNQAVNKEAYDQLDNRTKDNYYVIPTGEGKFIKVAKSRETGVLFGSLFERLYRLAQGEEESFKGFPNTVKTNFAPQNPFEDNIYSPINDLRRNKDFANRTIVPQSLQRLSPRYQYDERTSEIGKAIGDKFNLSPKQVDFLIKSYLGIIGTIALPATTKTANLKDTLSRQFIADPLYSNEVMDKFYERKEEVDRSFADQKVTGIRPPFPPAERTLYNTTADKFADTRKKINKILADPNKTDEQKKAETERLQGMMIQDAKKVLSRYKK